MKVNRSFLEIAADISLFIHSSLYLKMKSFNLLSCSFVESRNTFVCFYKDAFCIGSHFQIIWDSYGKLEKRLQHPDEAFNQRNICASGLYTG